MICLLQHVNTSKVFSYTFIVNKISDCEINIIVLFEGINKSYNTNPIRKEQILKIQKLISVTKIK